MNAVVEYNRVARYLLFQLLVQEVKFKRKIVEYKMKADHLSNSLSLTNQQSAQQQNQFLMILRYHDHLILLSRQQIKVIKDSRPDNHVLKSHQQQLVTQTIIKTEEYLFSVNLNRISKGLLSACGQYLLLVQTKPNQGLITYKTQYIGVYRIELSQLLKLAHDRGNSQKSAEMADNFRTQFQVSSDKLFSLGNAISSCQCLSAVINKESKSFLGINSFSMDKIALVYLSLGDTIESFEQIIQVGSTNRNCRPCFLRDAPTRFIIFNQQSMQIQIFDTRVITGKRYRIQTVSSKIDINYTFLKDYQILLIQDSPQNGIIAFMLKKRYPVSDKYSNYCALLLQRVLQKNTQGKIDIQTQIKLIPFQQSVDNRNKIKPIALYESQNQFVSHDKPLISSNPSESLIYSTQGHIYFKVNERLYIFHAVSGRFKATFQFFQNTCLYLFSCTYFKMSQICCLRILYGKGSGAVYESILYQKDKPLSRNEGEKENNERLSIKVNYSDGTSSLQQRFANEENTSILQIQEDYQPGTQAFQNQIQVPLVLQNKITFGTPNRQSKVSNGNRSQPQFSFAHNNNHLSHDINTPTRNSNTSLIRQFDSSNYPRPTHFDVHRYIPDKIESLITERFVSLQVYDDFLNGMVPIWINFKSLSQSFSTLIQTYEIQKLKIEESKPFNQKIQRLISQTQKIQWGARDILRIFNNPHGSYQFTHLNQTIRNFIKDQQKRVINLQYQVRLKQNQENQRQALKIRFRSENTLVNHAQCKKEANLAKFKEIQTKNINLRKQKISDGLLKRDKDSFGLNKYATLQLKNDRNSFRVFNSVSFKTQKTNSVNITREISRRSVNFNELSDEQQTEIQITGKSTRSLIGSKFGAGAASVYKKNQLGIVEQNDLPNRTSVCREKNTTQKRVQFRPVRPQKFKGKLQNPILILRTIRTRHDL